MRIDRTACYCLGVLVEPLAREPGQKSPSAPDKTLRALNQPQTLTRALAASNLVVRVVSEGTSEVVRVCFTFNPHVRRERMDGPKNSSSRPLRPRETGLALGSTVASTSPRVGPDRSIFWRPARGNPLARGPRAVLDRTRSRPRWFSENSRPERGGRSHVQGT